MKTLFSLLILWLLSSFIFSCYTRPITTGWRFDCLQEIQKPVTLPQQAIELAITYLNSKGITNYLRDSTRVQDDDPGIYWVIFKKDNWETVLPSELVVVVRKRDGCAAFVPLK